MYMESEKEMEIIENCAIEDENIEHRSSLSLQRRITNEIKKSKYAIKSTNNGRKCLKIDKDGSSYMIPLERHRLTNDLGIQLRDLRLLDPSYAKSYPSAILCRECALVINLEHIKIIVTPAYLLVMNPESNGVHEFVRELERKLANDNYSCTYPDKTYEFDRRMQKLSHKSFSESNVLEHLDLAQNNSRLSKELNRGHVKSSLADLPFELKILEVCLETVCGKYDEIAGQLEDTGYLAVDCLLEKVNTTNLQRVRSIKRKTFQLKTRVEKTKGVLDKFLEDDEDMKAMNLSVKLWSYKDNLSDLSARSLTRREHKRDTRNDARSSSSSSTDSVDEEVQEVEMLLEAYFMQLDNAFNKLETLCELINDAEDYINIVQDKHRNQLLQLELIITAGTFALTVIAVIAGIFGMNLNYKSDNNGAAFTLVSVLSSAGSIVIFVLIILFCRMKGLMFI